MRLQPVDYRKHWQHILPGLLEVLKYNGEGLWPEDVFAELRSGQAVLFLCEDCFCILKHQHSGIGQRKLLIWHAYAFDRRGLDQISILEDYQEELDEIARRAECQWQTCSSPRKGYERALPDGWEYAFTTWVRKVPMGENA